MSASTKHMVPDLNAGEDISFETLYKKYFSVIYAFCFSLLRQGQDAEDITNDTFLKLYRLLNNFDKESNIRGFLYTTSRNACMDYFRQKKKNDSLLALIQKETKEEDYTALNDELDRLHYHRVLAAIEKLPSRKKEIIHKLYLEEKDLQTVAEEMDMKVASVYSLHSRTLSLLKELLLNTGVNEGVLLFFMVFFLY